MKPQIINYNNNNIFQSLIIIDIKAVMQRVKNFIITIIITIINRLC